MTDSPSVSYGDQLRHQASANPDDVGLIMQAVDGTESSLSRADLDSRATGWGRALAARGAHIGDLVGIAIPNSADLALAALGCWKIGAVPVPMRWDLPDWERDRLLETLGATVVIAETNRTELAAAALAASDAPLPPAQSPMTNGICSSGSTGLPKIILNTRPAVWGPGSGEPFAAHWMNVPRPQTILVPGPMYHTNGFVSLIYLLGGDRLVVLEKFGATAVLDAIERHAVTTFTATPTMLARIADAPGARDRDLSSVRWIQQGAAAMPEPLLHRWFDLLSPEQIFMAYGMTEGLGLAALRGDEWLRHPGSVGRGFRGTEIRILADDGTPVPAGEYGEVYLRSPNNDAYRYLGGATPVASRDGFASAGDIGRLDDDGYLYIADRRSDMIVTGGANVFPAEVENALIGHDGIADVVVLGIKDPEWGRRVHAVVQVTAGAAGLTGEEVIAYAKGRLARYKVPKTVEFVEEIPRSAATKVSRSAMVAARGG